jgi:hypothetical protein
MTRPTRVYLACANFQGPLCTHEELHQIAAQLSRYGYRVHVAQWPTGFHQNKKWYGDSQMASSADALLYLHGHPKQTMLRRSPRTYVDLDLFLASEPVTQECR